MREDRVKKEIQVAASQAGGLLLRNNSGVAKELEPNGKIRYIRYGLGNSSAAVNKHIKSSDLIGITPIKVRREHVGQVLGVFTAIEVKTPGWTVPQNETEIGQQNFIQVIQSNGGFAGFATSEFQFYDIIRRAL